MKIEIVKTRYYTHYVLGDVRVLIPTNGDRNYCGLVTYSSVSTIINRNEAAQVIIGMRQHVQDSK